MTADGVRGRRPTKLGAGMAASAGATDAGSADGRIDPGLAGHQDRPVTGIDNGYVAGYRVRFDEGGPDGRLRAATLLRYAQDVAWRHSEHLGFDRTWYTERGRWWVARSVDLELLLPITMGVTLRVSTAVIGHRRIWARRRGEFRLPDGSLAAVATTDWVILDERGRLVRIPPDFGDVFPSRELDVDIIRVALPPAPAEAAGLAIHVRPSDIDPMGHVNNAVYLDWLDEAAEASGASNVESALPRRATLEYAASAGAGDDLEARAWLGDGGWWVRLVRAADGADIVRARLSMPHEATPP